MSFLQGSMWADRLKAAKRRFNHEHPPQRCEDTLEDTRLRQWSHWPNQKNMILSRNQTQQQRLKIPEYQVQRLRDKTSCICCLSNSIVPAQQWQTVWGAISWQGVVGLTKLTLARTKKHGTKASSPFSRAPTATRMTGTPQCLRSGRSLGAYPFLTCWKASLSVTEYLMTRMSACSRTFRTLAQSLSNKSWRGENRTGQRRTKMTKRCLNTQPVPSISP